MSKKNAEGKNKITQEEIDLLSKIRNLKMKALTGNQVWLSSKMIDGISDNIGSAEFKLIYSSEYLEGQIGVVLSNRWYSKYLIQRLLVRYTKLIPDILKTTPISWLRINLLSQGYYNSIEDINKLVKSSDIELKTFAVHRCSHHMLQELRKDDDRRIRQIAYKRLGVGEYLDDMLEDKAFQIRLIAAEAAPLHYPKFNEMVNEASSKVFYYIAKKIHPKQIPYILGNKGANDPHIKQILASRVAEPPLILEME